MVCVGQLFFNIGLDKTVYEVSRFGKNLLRISKMKHVVIYEEPGKFCGLPANHGIWSWGNEIAVGFVRGVYKETLKPPSADRSQPMDALLARSLDGGMTWSVEKPINFGEVFASAAETHVENGNRDSQSCADTINFLHPDLAIRCSGSEFRVSYDRGHIWEGPYTFPGFGLSTPLSSRTDYIVTSSNECLFFCSAYDREVQCKLDDRVFCARTRDGAQTFEFLSWIVGKSAAPRSVMPSSVRLGSGKLITTLRRRVDRHISSKLYKECWIDTYVSEDDGKSWTHIGKAADTDFSGTNHNGNPPSLLCLPDGRLCLTYAYRGDPLGIRARISADEGETWGEEIMLRKNARLWDIGYCRSVLRPDGHVVTVYYYTTDDHPENFVAATIWDPTDYDG